MGEIWVISDSKRHYISLMLSMFSRIDYILYFSVYFLKMIREDEILLLWRMLLFIWLQMWYTTSFLCLQTRGVTHVFYIRCGILKMSLNPYMIRQRQVSKMQVIWRHQMSIVNGMCQTLIACYFDGFNGSSHCPIVWRSNTKRSRLNYQAKPNDNSNTCQNPIDWNKLCTLDWSQKVA